MMRTWLVITFALVALVAATLIVLAVIAASHTSQYPTWSGLHKYAQLRIKIQ